MRSLGNAALTALLLASAACGSRSGSSTNTTSSGGDSCAGRGKVVARADLDGDGTRERVRLSGPRAGECGNSLVASIGGTGSGMDVGPLDLVADGARAVHLDGGSDLVLLFAERHPRGGAQPHLFGVDDEGTLQEVTVGGNPVVPFVATDGGAAPMTATCTDGGISVLRGTASQPPGVVLAWDISETTYDIRDAAVAETHTRTVRRDAADPSLRKEMPELFDGSLFSDCS